MTSQALPRSDAEQLRDARTANGLLRVRLTEQEALVAQYRARADALEARVEALEAHLGAAMSLVAQYRARADALEARLGEAMALVATHAEIMRKTL